MKKALQIFIGVAISVACLVWAFWDVKLTDLLQAFGQTNWLYAIPMVGLTLLSFYWRCFQWKVFLDPVKELPARRLFPSLMIGFGFNNVFPFRAGEVARPLALQKQEGIPFGTGLSTVALSRAVDALALLILLITMPLYITLDENISVDIANFTVNAAWLRAAMPKVSLMAVIILAGAVSFLIPAMKNLYIRITRALPLVPDWLKEKLVAFIEAIATGFASLKSMKALFLSAFHTAIIWVLVALSFQVMSWGFPGVALTFGQALAFLVVTCAVLSIPSSPGFWGVYELGGKLALLMMGVVPQTEAGSSSAIAFTMVVHFLQWAPLTIIGLYYAAKLHVSSSDVARPAQE